MDGVFEPMWIALILVAICATVLAFALAWTLEVVQEQRGLNAVLREQMQTMDAQLGQDGLTKLTSRARFMDLVADGKRTGEGALVLIDVDGFKSVNDTYGHATGDRLLAKIAAQISAHTPEDVIAARVGGDEFALYLPGLSLPDATALVNTMRADVADTEIMSSWKNVRRSISAGVALLPEGGALESAMGEADTALYSAKDAGRNRVVMVDAIVRDRRREAKAEPTIEDMQSGVENSEFTYYVQPIFNVLENRPVGVEALIRWVTEDGTVRLPGEFMHMFTSQYNGTIKPPLDAANEVAASFAQPENELFCAFNISSSFLRRSFEPNTRWLDELLMGIDPKRAVFEIVESAAIDNTTAARNMLSFLREQGVRIALDDFGTGHSNLSRLVDLPIDIVKIDRIFTSQLPGNTRKRAIVSALMSLSRELGYEVVAEGVETQEQLDALRELGVTMAQGFYLARPQTVSDWQQNRGLLRSA